jgi:hypothetical protein
MAVSAKSRTAQGISGLIQPFANGEAGQLRAVVNLELDRQVGGVAIDGLDADVQQAGDLSYSTIPRRCNEARQALVKSTPKCGAP